jgi:hypothetical protein
VESLMLPQTRSELCQREVDGSNTVQLFLRCERRTSALRHNITGAALVAAATRALTYPERCELANSEITIPLLLGPNC